MWWWWCNWESSSWRCKGSWYLHIQGWAVQLLDCLTLKIKAPWPFDTPVNTNAKLSVTSQKNWILNVIVPHRWDWNFFYFIRRPLKESNATSMRCCSISTIPEEGKRGITICWRTTTATYKTGLSPRSSSLLALPCCKFILYASSLTSRISDQGHEHIQGTSKTTIQRKTGFLI